MRYIVDTEKARQIHQRCYLMSKMWKLWIAVLGIVAVVGGIYAILAPVRIILNAYFALLSVCALTSLLSCIIYIRLKGQLSVKYIDFIDNPHPEIVSFGIRPPQGSDGYDGIQEVYIKVRDSAGVTDIVVLGIANVVFNNKIEANTIDITNNRIVMIA